MEAIFRLNTKTKIKLSLIIFLVLLIFSLFLSASATPSSIFFPLKRLQEKIFLKLKPNAPAQVEYLSSLLDIRLEELKIMVDGKDYSTILDASLRYSATAGNITDMVLENKLVAEGNSLKNKLIDQKKTLQEILNSYPVDFNTERKYIEDDINYLSIYIEKLSSGLSAPIKSGSASN